MKIGNDAEVGFDEFARVCDLVAEYFGTTIENVALETAVSRRQLVAVLARAQLTGRQWALEGFDADATLVAQSNDESVLWFDDDVWIEIAEIHHLDAGERRAAREVHRRLLEVFDDGPKPVRDREPFVLIEQFDGSENRTD